MEQRDEFWGLIDRRDPEYRAMLGEWEDGGTRLAEEEADGAEWLDELGD